MTEGSSPGIAPNVSPEVAPAVKPGVAPSPWAEVAPGAPHDVTTSTRPNPKVVDSFNSAPTKQARKD